MSAAELLLGGLVEIRHHKLRSFLTLTGIILGTLSIVFMTSLLNGVIGTLWDGFSQLGFDGVMYVMPRQPKDAAERARFSLSEGLRPRDAEVLMARRELVAGTAPVQRESLVMSAGTTLREVQVAGVTPSYAAVRRRFPARGRFLNEQDMRLFARVCILGHRLERRLFGVEDSIGKEVDLEGARFRVVGVGEKLGNMFVNDEDFIEEMEGALVPLTTLRKYVTGEDASLSFIAVKTTAYQSLSTVQAEIQASLSVAHRGVNDFRVANIAQDIVRSREEVEEVVFNWQVVLLTIAGISLLVGGVGLLSVMLISINERLYEIGLRKAIGATDLEIFVQFLSESIALALVGALVGVGAGVGLSRLLAGQFPSGLPVEWSGIAGAITVAVALGAAFGLYPALKASRLAPVDAMRG